MNFGVPMPKWDVLLASRPQGRKALQELIDQLAAGHESSTACVTRQRRWGLDEPRMIPWLLGGARADVASVPWCLELVAGTQIELVAASDPIIQRFFEQHVGWAEKLAVVEPTPELRSDLVLALSLLQSVAPRLHDLLLESLRAIVLFSARSSWSFAAVGIHGMIFLNARIQPTVPFFLDGLVHQGGHVLFTEATTDRASYFVCPPDTPLGSLLGIRDIRTAYEFMHGLFTEYALLATLPPTLGVVTKPLTLHELRGRIALTFERFARDVDLARSCSLFSAKGLALFSVFERALNDLREGPLLDHGFDLRGQPNDFDVDLFIQSNPLRIPHAFKS